MEPRSIPLAVLTGGSSARVEKNQRGGFLFFISHIKFAVCHCLSESLPMTNNNYKWNGKKSAAGFARLLICGVEGVCKNRLKLSGRRRRPIRAGPRVSGRHCGKRCG